MMLPTMQGQPPLFVINLRRAPERRVRMIELLGGMGLTPQIVEAVDGKLLDAEGSAYWKACAERRILNPGEIGCMLSHIAVWRRVVADGLSHAVVLEDDLCFAPGFEAVVREAGQVRDIDLLKLETDLAHNVVIDRRPAAQIAGANCHRLRGGSHRTGGYVIFKDAATRLLSASRDFRHALDVEMFDRSRSAIRELVVHQLVPAVCVQAELRPHLDGNAPFLQSTINVMGERADTVLGLKRRSEGGLARSIRGLLRPIKRLLSKSTFAVIGRCWGLIPFAGDGLEPASLVPQASAQTVINVENAASRQGRV